MTAPIYTFLPFFRRGAAAAVDHVIGGRGAATLSLTLDQPTDIPITVHGPGDVTGIDRSMVRRFDPTPGALDAEAYLFASVEFALPDLPWMFTPHAPRDGRLAPWLALVVVRGDASALEITPRGLPRLQLANGAELPDLAEAWAWAHAQVIGEIDRPIASIAGEQPERVTSRLLSPRKLEPGVAWRACLVPAFAAGRAAGLGEPPPQNPLDPAWSAIAAPVTLPVYLHWEFSTASGDDFETLGRRLEARELSSNVGRLPIDLREPGGGVRGFAGAAALAGALGTTADLSALPAEAANTVEDITRIVDAPTDPLVVSPPHYGSRDIDVDPRWRAVAGLGAEAVRRDQEELVEASWEQVGEVRDANRALGWIRVARHVAIGIHRKHFQRISAEALAMISAPAHGRIREPNASTTLRVAMRTQLTFASAVAPEFRRAVRPTRRVFRSRPPVLGGGIAARPAPPTALVTPQRVAAALGNPPALARMRFGQWTPQTIGATPRRNQFWIVDENGQSRRPPLSPLFPHVSPDEQAFRGAAMANLAGVAAVHALATRPRPVRVTGVLDRTRLLALLDPAPAFRVVAAERIATPDGGGDALDPITGAPVFSQPAFRAVAQPYLLPGLERVPANTTSIVVPNPRFAQAFLAGMNHELRRELLWREFPCDRDAVFFTSFWGHDGAVSVLLVRGDLVRRFPGLVILSVPAVNGAPDLATGHETLPLFRGGLEPDAVFAGFPFTRDQARERFFLLQQRPSAPRFGLDASSEIAIASLAQRNDLAWTHMPAGTHATIAGPLEQRVFADGTEQATWGRTAADQAWLTLQLPVRLVMPGSKMVPA